LFFFLNLAATQDSETNEIVRIAYTDKFSEVYGYLRAVVRANEISDRAFELTRDAALLNPANYTVWYYRRRILTALNKDLRDELNFISDVIRSNPKNYQVWQHRRSVVDQLQEGGEELAFTQQIIRRDSKNYHAWQYRQWAMNRFGLWEPSEVEYVNELIEQDVRNNSAWNQRFFYLSNKHELADGSEAATTVLNAEIDYCLGKIQLCVDNESSWNYLRALIVNLNGSRDTAVYPQRVVDFCAKKLSSERDDERSPFLFAFVVDYNVARARDLVKELEGCGNEKNDSELRANVGELVRGSVELLEKLGGKYDTIRVNYWNYLLAKYKQQFSGYL
jgi:protein farnesyltransferase/geranylgeranyltransferase type-1 subunit alpha